MKLIAINQRRKRLRAGGGSSVHRPAHSCNASPRDRQRQVNLAFASLSRAIRELFTDDVRNDEFREAATIRTINITVKRIERLLFPGGLKLRDHVDAADADR